MCACFFEHPCAFTQRRSGRHHIVDKQHTSLRDPFWACNGECAQRVHPTVSRIILRLTLRLPDSDQRMAVDAPVDAPCQLLSEQVRLIVRTFTKPHGVKRDRHNNVNLRGLKMRRQTPGKQIGQVLFEPERLTIFELMEQLTQHPVEVPGRTCFVKSRPHVLARTANKGMLYAPLYRASADRTETLGMQLQALETGPTKVATLPIRRLFTAWANTRIKPIRDTFSQR
jgi:hypothetical protein